MAALWYPNAQKDHAQNQTYLTAAKYIVWHDTEGYPAGDLSVLRSGGGRSVSAHFLVLPDGKVVQFLPLNVGANHAGYSNTGLASSIGNPNHYAIGIELSHPPKVAEYPKAQLDAAWKLLQWLDSQFGKLPQVGHREIDPSRKSDPNGDFPLKAFKDRTYGVPATPAEPTVYKAMAASMRFSNLRASDVQAEAELKAWAKKWNRALFESREDGSLPPRLQEWYPIPLN